MKCLGEVIIHHMRVTGSMGANSEASYRSHRLPAHRMAVVNLTSLLVQLLCTTVPLDLVSTGILFQSLGIS